MAKIRNVSGEDRIVPGLGGRLVVAGAVVDVPADQEKSYTCQKSTWRKVAPPRHRPRTAAPKSDPDEGPGDPNQEG